MKHRQVIVVTVLISILLLGVLPDAMAKKFVPKTGNERRSLMLSEVQKRFIVNRNTEDKALRRISGIENALYVVDENGAFPPRSFLRKLAVKGKPMQLVLPASSTQRQLAFVRSLGTKAGVTFRLGADTDVAGLVGRARSLGPRSKIFEISASEVNAKILADLKPIRVYELRVLVADGKKISRKTIRMLNSLPVMKEIVIPADSTADRIRAFRGMKQTRLILNVRGVGPTREQIDALNGLDKIESGANTRGVLKKNELLNYTLIDRLRVLTMSVEDWKISKGFVELMNSKGEMH